MNPRWLRFAAEYLIDLNGARAYGRAGYTAKGNAAEVGASKLLSNPKVREEIERLKAERSKRTGIDADWLLARLAQEAEADLRDIYDAKGNLKPVDEWPVIWRTGLVAGIETVSERVGEDADGNPIYAEVRKVKLADRTKRLELIGRHVSVQAFKDRIEHADVTSRAQRMAAARKRVAEAKGGK